MSFGNGENFYAILGAGKTASPDEIERLYKHLARQHHPDRGGDAEVMKVINEAYRVLGNEDTRRLYDSHIQVSEAALRSVVPPLSPPSALLPDTVAGRLISASLVLLIGLTFLFLVRIYYIRFMWPIFIVAALVVILGVRKLHGLWTGESGTISLDASQRMGSGTGVLVYRVRRRLRHLSTDELNLKDKLSYERSENVYRRLVSLVPNSRSSTKMCDRASAIEP